MQEFAHVALCVSSCAGSLLSAACSLPKVILYSCCTRGYFLHQAFSKRITIVVNSNYFQRIFLTNPSIPPHFRNGFLPGYLVPALLQVVHSQYSSWYMTLQLTQFVQLGCLKVSRYSTIRSIKPKWRICLSSTHFVQWPLRSHALQYLPAQLPAAFSISDVYDMLKGLFFSQLDGGGSCL